MTRRIAIIVEGATEKAFEPALRRYLNEKLQGRMPRLKFISEDGRIPTGENLRRDVIRLLSKDYDTVIALTDVYTGSHPPQFVDAADARKKMSEWVGNEPRFYPHAAQYRIRSLVATVLVHNSKAVRKYPRPLVAYSRECKS